ncbi:MAG TPA: prephenate dehydratase [Caldilineaceae bacterium]|nr:prephenate dehydratase [Caldilineaceae bacterium]
MTIVAFQGEHGAYSEEATQQHFGETVETLPCHAFEHMFDALEERRADFAMLPVENSTAGSINKSFDLLLEHDFKVHGEVMVRVRHNLLALPGAAGQITHVRSHPQALAQCESFMNRHHYTAVPWYDTAGSAKDLAANPVDNVGVVASRLAAKIYGLEIVEEDIEDLQHNYTRFFVVGPGEAPRTQRSKTTLVFAVPNAAGSLYGALEEFARRRINLTKLESRPRRNRPWQYVFYVDFDGHWQDPDATEGLVYLLNRAAFVKLLGSYPAAAPLENSAKGAQAQLLQI